MFQVERVLNRPFPFSQKPSLLKRGQVQNLSCENEFYLHDNKKKSFFDNKGFAVGLGLKQRLGASRK